MVIDARYHLAEQITPVNDLLGQMDRAGVGRAALIPATQDPFVPPAVVGTLGGMIRSMLTGPLRSPALSFYRSIRSSWDRGSDWAPSARWARADASSALTAPTYGKTWSRQFGRFSISPYPPGIGRASWAAASRNS